MGLASSGTLVRTHVPLARTQTRDHIYLQALSSGRRMCKFGESANHCPKIMTETSIHNSLTLLENQAKHLIHIMFKLIHPFKVYNSVGVFLYV